MQNDAKLNIVSVDTVTLTITADDEIYVYHGGQLVLAESSYGVVHNVSLDGACVLAFYAVNHYDDGVVLASTSTGVVTDASWKCSSGLQFGDWQSANFDDTACSQALIIASNNDDNVMWQSVEEISADAKWIWAQDTSSDVAYCRKTLC